MNGGKTATCWRKFTDRGIAAPAAIKPRCINPANWRKLARFIAFLFA
jgi:hypothetical protein